jgi:tripartite-type tricarboxylate transporter receptor subunit TctC
VGGVARAGGVVKNLTNKLHGEVTRMLTVQSVRERFAAQDAELVGSRPDEIAKMLQSEILRWSEVIRVAGIARQ